ncbi:hypothetical protein diail_5367 [Diaporthe ilicicola]|nr:hypothetical protein diail_5367 [Diaporthe ilicicola]
MSGALLTDAAGSIASTPHLLPALRAVVSVVLLFLSGKPPLRFWCIPMLRRCPPSPTQVSQFSVIIEQGYAIMLPTSQLLSASLLSLTLLTASHPDQDTAGLWKWHAFSVLVLVVMDRWEKRAIFPVNEQILAFAHDLEIGKGKGSDTVDFTPEEKEELKDLLDTWAARHPWRIVVPLTCGLITFAVAVSQTV